MPGTGQDMAKMDASDKRAEDLYQLAHRMDPSLGKDAVSVTTWMGYDRPMDIFDPTSDKWAGKPDFALNGAQALDEWQDALRITHDDAAAGGRSFNTVIGHSYGSAEVGAAATHGRHLDADAIAGVGSPGMFANQLSDFNINTGGTVFVATADNDMIKMASVGDPVIEPLGPDPRTVTGAYQFQTDPGPEGDWYYGGLSGDAHSSYFTQDSTGMTSMAQIILGQTPKHA
ncbi:MAG: alpha/beta hydrolase [Segniliparus sp.]|uniref:alpha/beta hydrolase n=1 Tax=Segniliparus sp. TaxID=2804064 RepID=UPI003F40C7B5